MNYVLVWWHLGGMPCLSQVSEALGLNYTFWQGLAYAHFSGRIQCRAKYHRFKVPGSFQSSLHKMPRSELRNHSRPPLLECPPAPALIPMGFQQNGHV